MSYIPSENGAKVNLIKQKFEENLREVSPNKPEDQNSLRRSLSASPVKAKRNLKLNVTRQLSNPGKNIKRTPAFRGDKLSRIKNLTSPSREKPSSIVHKNMKIFEESPEYGKLGNVKKKENLENSLNDDDFRKTKDKKFLENSTVRTTVISRQKNIFPLENRENSSSNEFLLDFPGVNNEIDSNRMEKFLMNGVEYTKVVKPPKTPEIGGRNAQGDDQDIREELSRRKSEENMQICSNSNENSVSLTETLKAALQAPLPPGPPPKKPPRTFAHSPLTTRDSPSSPEESLPPKIGQKSFLHGSDCDVVDFCSDDDFSFFKSSSRAQNLQENLKKSQDFERKNLNNLKCEDSDEKNSKNMQNKSRTAKDSKKMLEKLETVLIQHQKALGPKVIVPRKENGDIPIGFEAKTSFSTEKMEKTSVFANRLSRTMESESRKVSLGKLQEQRNRKHSTFDCLPYLNCVSGSVYQQPTFRNYFEDAGDDKSKSEDSLSSSISNILNSSEFYDESLSPGAKRLSTELTTFMEGRRRASGNCRSEERVYAEPFAFDKNSGTDITGFGELSPEEHNYLSRSWCNEGFREESKDEGRKQSGELHYLCTPIHPTLLEDNNNGIDEVDKGLREAGSFFENNSAHGRPSLDGPNRVKVEQLLNQAFGKFTMAGTETSTDSNTSSDTDSLASTLSLTEELTSFSDKLRLFKNRENKLSKEELHRSLTEKRKCYVRKVSIKYSEKCDVVPRRKDRLFDVCLLVELNLSTRVPYIKDKYPIYAEVPAWIENFCFPDAQDWPPEQSDSNQFHSLFLMDEKGNRRYGYCIRVRPEGGPILPLAYCLITKHRASGFYHKVLQQLESKHGLPDKNRRGFIEELYNSSMPKPGYSLRMIKERPEVIANLLTNNNKQSNKVNNQQNGDVKHNNSTNDSEQRPVLSEKRQNESEKRQNESERRQNESEKRLLDVSQEYESLIMRSGDPRLEEKDMSQLFDSVSNKVLILLFGSLLLERKVVLLGSKLSKLSSCVEALQSLLYPFSWPHTFIPVLPDIEGLGEILGAPPPFVIGILKGKNGMNVQIGQIQDGVVVDLDSSKVVHAVGDEGSILPKRLQEGIRSALQLVANNTKDGDDIRNFLVSEAFLRVFVETCAHLEGHLVAQQDGKIIFQKESFVKASSSKAVQFFLEWFVETIMFNAFVTDYIASIEGTTVEEKYDIKLFKQRVAEYKKLSEKNAQTKKAKKKTFGKFTFNF